MSANMAEGAYTIHTSSSESEPDWPDFSLSVKGWSLYLPLIRNLDLPPGQSPTLEKNYCP